MIIPELFIRRVMEMFIRSDWMKRIQMIAFWSLAMVICFSACDPKPETVGETTPESAAALATQPEMTPSSTAPLPTTTTTLPTGQPSLTAVLPSATPSMLFPFRVIVSPGVWLIEQHKRDIQIQFDTTRWESTQFDTITPLFYEGGPVLVHKEIDGCKLSLNFGGGVPMDWSLEREAFLLGDHEIPLVSFYDGDGELQFVIYDALLRVTFGYDVDGCLQEAEVVMSNYQVSVEE